MSIFQETHIWLIRLLERFVRRFALLTEFVLTLYTLQL